MPTAHTDTVSSTDLRNLLDSTEPTQIVDVRTPEQFDDAHVPRAVCIPIVEAGFGTKLAWIASHDQEE